MSSRDRSSLDARHPVRSSRGGQGADAYIMRWKMLVGCLLAVLGGVGLVRDLSEFNGSAYEAGSLAGGMVLLLLGLLLIRADAGSRAG